MTAPAFRLAARNDIAATVELLNQTFRTPIDEATWEWYLYGNPFGATRAYLAIDAERQTPAGLFAFTPVPLKIAGASVAASSGHHLCLTSAYQGGSAFIYLSRYALAGEAEQGVTLGLGLPNQKSHQPQKILMKWDDLCFLDCLYKLAPSPQEHACRPLERFTEEFDEFYSELTRSLDFYIEKNAAWMNWRFFDRPGKPYTVYTIEQQARLSGYVVLKRWRESSGYTKAHIVDMNALDEAALTHLMAAAESYAHGCQELNLWSAPGYPYRGFLEARGFVARPEARQPLIGKTLAGPQLVLPNGSTSFSYADGDFVY